MKRGRSIAFFGSSLVSAYWNGAATYYRGLLKALAARGHRITFYEPDAFDRQRHRDLPDPPWARVVVYPATDAAVAHAVESARGADVIVKASGVGVYDDFLASAIPDARASHGIAIYWDVDAPATLDRAATPGGAEFGGIARRYDLVLTYGGGDPVVHAYNALGVERCIPIYNGLDPETHRPAPADARFAGDLAFLGNRLPDREARVDEFFLRPAQRLAHRSFVLGGSGWADRTLPDNVRAVGHVYTADHNAFNCTPTAVLNISRESMARYGFSPATRVFEAAGAGACIITDEWDGIETFLEPDREILVAADGDGVVDHVGSLDARRARAIGEAARRRVLAEHTYAERARLVERVLDGCTRKEVA